MFLNTVVPAGLMPLPLLSLIESRLLERLLGQISTFLHKSLSPVRCKMMDAMVESQFLLSHGCTTIKSLMRLALSIEPEAMTTESNALQSPSAETVTHTSLALSQMSTLSTTLMSLLTLRERRK